MNPGLLVKLRPNGPWRIGPDSGARNRVDSIFHSDSLYSAVTAALARLGSLEEWLEATARKAAPEVALGSCFPFAEDMAFVVPPRTVWPPTTPAQLSARVRWKSARFVPLSLVPALVAGESLDDSHWMVDGASECLLPAGRQGPFRTAVRWSAAIDRLSGSSDRHSIACLEFRPGAGLWTLVSFANEAARDRWQEPLKGAFRWLADTGLGGERSRGWGRSDAPEFIEGELPGLILPSAEPVSAAAAQAAGPAAVRTADETAARIVAAAAVPVTDDSVVQTPSDAAAPAAGNDAAAQTADDTAAPSAGDTTVSAASDAAAENAAEPKVEPKATAPRSAEPKAAGTAHAAVKPVAHWLLSLFTPSAAETVDWHRGNYTVLARGGRIESPHASGDLKKWVNMVEEGSVVYAAEPPRGAAPDVAPDGFAHPVFRAGFAVSVPLPEAG